jgi:hypothetical protein
MEYYIEIIIFHSMVFYPQLPQELWMLIYRKEHEMFQISVNRELNSLRIATDNANNRLIAEWKEDGIRDIREDKLWNCVSYLDFIKYWIHLV